MGAVNPTTFSILTYRAFEPNEISGLKAWYDASDTATITVSGTAVTQWNDKSGNGYNLTQGTAGLRPISGVRTQNGKNAIDFDGSNDVLNAATASNWTFLSNTSGATVFVTVFADTASDARYIWSTFGGSFGYVGSYQSVLGNDNTSIGSAVGNGALAAMYLDTSTPVATDNTAFTITAQFDLGKPSASQRGYLSKNGGTQVNNNTATDAASSSSPQTPLGVGGLPGFSESWDGLICELIIYNAVLNATDRGKVITYLASKWGI